MCFCKTVVLRALRGHLMIMVLVNVILSLNRLLHVGLFCVVSVSVDRLS